MERTEAIEELRRQIKTIKESGDRKWLYDLIQKEHLLMIYLSETLRDEELNDRENVTCKEIDLIGAEAVEDATTFIVESGNQEKKLRIAGRLKEIYQMMARRDFEKFLIAIEWNYNADMKFYDIRKNVIKEWAEELEKLEYGEYMGLSISAPPRTRKNRVWNDVFYVVWTKTSR